MYIFHVAPEHANTSILKDEGCSEGGKKKKTPPLCKNCMCITAPFNHCHSSGSTINSFTLQLVELRFRGAKKTPKLVRQPAWRRGEIRSLACVIHLHPAFNLPPAVTSRPRALQTGPEREAPLAPGSPLTRFRGDDGQAGCGLSRVV